MNENTIKLAEKAYQLRAAGNIYRKVGEALGVTASRAMQLDQIYKHLQKMEDWQRGLSYRTLIALQDAEAKTKEQVTQQYLKWNQEKPSRWPRCYSWVRHKELARCLGMPEPIQPTPKRRTCPHCGKEI